MDVENMLEAEENLDSLIKLEGNYFIMDSEQLVSNPFQELQQDAVNEANTKKNSMTEKLTIVKNNVCENHFQMAKSSLERQRTSKLKQLHDNSNKLRHEVKLLDLDRQRHTVEVRKRLEPEKDYSYDEVQIHNTERRLGANIASFYLDKKLKYPMRLRSMKDIRVTPTISRARAKIRTSDVNKTLEDENGRFSRQDRAQTAKTTVSSIGHAGIGAGYNTNSSATLRRRGSRSAPVHNNRATRSAGCSMGNKTTTAPLFPAIGTTENQQETNNTSTNNKRAGLMRSKTYQGSGSVVGSEKDHSHQQQVKFTFENPLKILASSEESANMFARSCSYYPGSTRAVNFGFDSSDDEDALSEPERIDLRAILFPDDQNNNKTGTYVHNINNNTPMHSAMSQHQIWALRKAQGPAPKLSTTQKEAEASVMDAKINKFLERLALARLKKRRRHGYDSDSSEEEEAIENGVGGNISGWDAGGGEGAGSNPTPSMFQKPTTASVGTTTNNNNNNNIISTNNNHSNSIGTNVHTSIYSNPMTSNNKNDDNSFKTPTDTNSTFNNNNNDSKNNTQQNGENVNNARTNSSSNNNNNNNENNPSHLQNHQHDPHRSSTVDDSTIPRKYNWRYIRGKPSDGKLHGTYQTEDLVIQALTGVPISNAIHTHVPMHSASRAMRHTATFKMHKIVERLIHERTKYERHQVEEIKRQQLGEGGAGGGSSETPTESGVGVGGVNRRISKATILSTQLSNR